MGDSWDTKAVRVNVLVYDMLSQPVSHTFEISSNYFLWYLSYGAHMTLYQREITTLPAYIIPSNLFKSIGSCGALKISLPKASKGDGSESNHSSTWHATEPIQYTKYQTFSKQPGDQRRQKFNSVTREDNQESKGVGITMLFRDTPTWPGLHTITIKYQQAKSKCLWLMQRHKLSTDRRKTGRLCCSMLKQVWSESAKSESPREWELQVLFVTSLLDLAYIPYLSNMNNLWGSIEYR